jgi:electron transport complex protein RnfG
MSEHKPVTLIVAVLVTCIVSAAGLSATYAVTKDRIAEQDRRALEESLRGALPGARSFAEVTDGRVLEAAAEAAGEVQVRGVYRAEGSDGAPAGWGLRLASRGYGGYMQLVIGLDRDGSVAGVTILSMNETPGLGTRVKTEAWFLEQFTTLEGGFTAKDVRALDGIAGATKSSRAVKHAVEAAGAIWGQVLSKGGE